MSDCSGYAVPATEVAEWPASARSSLHSRLQSPTRAAARMQDEQNLRRLAVNALDASLGDLSRALRRQGIIAYATSLEEDCVPVVAFLVISMARAFQTPYETVLSHLHPALPACLRCAGASHTDGGCG